MAARFKKSVVPLAGNALGWVSRSLATRLSFYVRVSSVILTVAVLALSLVALFQRAQAQMGNQARHSLTFLGETLAVPLQSSDLGAIRAIGRALAQDELVELLEIFDSRGEILFSQTKGETPPLERQEPVWHNGRILGSVRLGLNDSLRHQAVWAVTAIGIGLTALMVCLQFLLRALLFKPLLQRPFEALDRMIKAYAAGNFSPAQPNGLCAEFAALVQLLLDMGATIRGQLAALKKSEQRLALALDASRDGL